VVYTFNVIGGLHDLQVFVLSRVLLDGDVGRDHGLRQTKYASRMTVANRDTSEYLLYGRTIYYRPTAYCAYPEQSKYYV